MKKATLAALILVLTMLPANAASTDGEFVLTCPYSHSLPDDPIVFPGQPGVSHLHDFYGNVSTNAASTYATMHAASTLCVEKADTAGYWTPALYKNGVKVDPNTTNGARTTIYYANNLSGYPSTAIKPIPKGLKMIAGNSHATSVATNPELSTSGDIYYGCSDNSTGKLVAPPNCSSGIISLHVGFPNCWDGVHLDSADHQSHMAYPVSTSGGYRCPASHPVPIPRIIIRVEYPIGTNSGTVTLSSGPTYTIHADFFQTYHAKRINALIDQCIHANINCGTDPGH